MEHSHRQGWGIADRRKEFIRNARERRVNCEFPLTAQSGVRVRVLPAARGTDVASRRVYGKPDGPAMSQWLAARGASGEQALTGRDLLPWG